MKFYKIVALTVLVLLVTSCGNNPEASKRFFSLHIKDQKKTYTPKDSFTVSIINKKNKTIESIDYYIDSEKIIMTGTPDEISVSLSKQKLGKRKLIAKITAEGTVYEASQNITLVSSELPKLYSYTILETYPHDIDAYTQGLEFRGDTLYESTGQYKESSLRKTDYKSGEVLQKIDLADHYFGEGLTFFNDKVYQLTWKEKTGFIYNANNLQKTGTFVYGKSKEGWGLCNNGEIIFKSDGTEKIWSLNSNTLAEESYIEIYTNTRKIKSVNELEWVDGKIYANVYQKDAIAIVNPLSGAVEGVINLKGLKDNVTQHEKLDVLNGIAYKGEKNILYITGKNWDKLFKIEVVERK